MTYCPSNLIWYQPAKRWRVLPRPAHLGDALSPFIVARTLEELLPQAMHRQPASRLLAVGSILNHARDGDTVWGTGYNGIKPRHDYMFRNLDVRAVRGPETRRMLGELGVAAPPIYGDPGLLLPRYVKARRTPRRGVLRIFHYAQRPARLSGVRSLRTVGTDFQAFADAVSSAKLVISSSLHGLILAEAYGTPAVWLADTSTETDSKYRDYYLGTGRDSFPRAESMEEALGMAPPALFDLDAAQEILLRAFPVDLWR
jgi:pyruvyltransferase